MSERKDMELIAELVPKGSRVLDLGCGRGELLAYLQDQRGCTGYGIEIDDDMLLNLFHQLPKLVILIAARKKKTTSIDLKRASRKKKQ